MVKFLYNFHKFFQFIRQQMAIESSTNFDNFAIVYVSGGKHRMANTWNDLYYFSSTPLKGKIPISSVFVEKV